MLRVHHLINSRSQRIIWLLEELGAPYQVLHYERDPYTGRASREFKALHPLGKAPIVEEDGKIFAESGAIIEHVLRKYSGGRLRPGDHSPDRIDYDVLLHHAEGSAFAWLLAFIKSDRSAAAAEELQAQIAFLSGVLGDRNYFVGEDFTAADIQVACFLEVAREFGQLASHENLNLFLSRMHRRPAYLRAVEVGRGYNLAW
ncbi:glutathione S-transferase [Phenylobacterium sp.]|uniref:glutathione S-transferase family protein n=1 Tax=Phenylobacterium sp. TaxID=1871053 RepID=UPI0028A12BF9|nr:glutathione S-transferase [Phenylobacterium sp.]